MKKVVYILTLAVAVALAACNSGDESSASKSGDVSGEMTVTETSATSDAEASAQDAGVSSPVASPQPNGNQVNPVQAKPEPKAPFTPEEAAKYKEAITQVKAYSEELNKCVDAKMNGKAIDETTKKHITEIQNKLD
ncbi:MAG: hypothetical protein J5629_09245, partial [Muribaculaceae bacterium]|nr:hypothetical protein [Muribaculaceae bacterium]